MRRAETARRPTRDEGVAALEDEEPGREEAYRTMQLMQQNFFLDRGLLRFDRDAGRLEINSDLFNFGRQVWPRLRIRAGFEIVKRFWLLAGIDDAINPTRDYFVGLQRRFDDQDLKPLIPLGAVAIP